MLRYVVYVALRDVGFGVPTPIYDFRYQKDLPLYFHWIFLFDAMWDILNRKY